MESLIPPFNAYKGEEPFIFVSYAHRNSEVVFAHITRLHNEGFRIWYDEGIDPGTDWSDEIASALVNAEIFLVFISDAAVASNNVRKEIVFAIDQKKHMVCVHVEETELPSGLKMQLGNIQALLENRFLDKEKFYNRLFNALLPEKTRSDTRSNVTIKDVPRSAKKKSGKKSSPWLSPKILFALLALVVLVAGIWGGVALMPQPGSEVVFSDAKLEAAIRVELNKPGGTIRKEDLAASKTDLHLKGMGITDISPLKYMRNLSVIVLDYNQIVDITPLGDLPGVSTLTLANNRISDLTPLRGLRNSLHILSIQNNPVKDLKQLRSLSELKTLVLTGVPITDLELGRYLRKLSNVFFTEEGHGLSAEDLFRFKANLPANCTITILPGKGDKEDQ